MKIFVCVKRVKSLEDYTDIVKELATNPLFMKSASAKTETVEGCGVLQVEPSRTVNHKAGIKSRWSVH